MRTRDPAMASYEQARREIAGSGSNIQPAQYQEGQYQEQVEAADDGIEISDLAPENLGQTVRKLTGNGPNTAVAKQLMAEAEQLYANASNLRQQNPSADVSAQFVAAAKKFDEAGMRWPDSALEQDALYMQGESYFFADYYWDAELAYEGLLEKYQHSRHLDAVQPRRFAIANYWLALHREDPQAFYELNVVNESLPTRDAFGHAMRVFDRIRLDDPTGKLADDATLALGNAYFANRKFMKADEYYTDLRKTFPSSEHQFEAHFLGLKAKLESYQGADYSADAINTAEKLITQIRKQFPLEAQEKQEVLNVELARVRFLKAERDWLMAQRFDRRTEYGAAKHYYSALITEYPETPFAQQAQLRMREIGGLPEIPQQRLSWLVDAFPSDEDIKPIFASGNGATIRR
jgi:outer membrane protein assembly factor BamD (BamD/ComL family)